MRNKMGTISYRITLLSSRFCEKISISVFSFLSEIGTCDFRIYIVGNSLCGI